MNPFLKTVIFSEKKPNHFYCIKKNSKYIKIDNPIKGESVYEVPTISGGAVPEKILLEIPIPLCQKHQNGGIPFGVKTCNNWEYIVIPTLLGSLTCKKCINELFLPQPYLHSANLRNANLRYADLSYANLCNTDLRYADMRNTDLRYANLHNSNICNTNLRYADMHNSNICNTNLRYANLRNADMRYADMRYADLRNANLSYANLRYADMRNANLSYANLRYVDLRYVDLRYANNINKSLNLDKVYWNKFTKINESFKKLLNKGMFMN